ncbi:MAG TPA: hypothetical protein VK425_00005, partial [Acidimicrobiales bacterium]|nr:hypothetical protein [Acidimicrobiales bacterium]
MSAGDLPGDLAALVGALGPEATVVVSANGGAGTVLRPQAGVQVGAADERPLGGYDLEPAPALAGPRADAWTAFNGAFVRVPWRVS